jgi:hypothetical protein
MKSKAKRRRTAADVAVNLVARNVLRGLRMLDWEKWKTEYVSKPDNLEKVVAILARLSREALLRERFREELRAQQSGKRPPTRQDLTELTGVNLM